MTSPMRTLRAGLRLLALAASLGAATAHASGGGDPVDLFFSSARPDQPVREFVERPAGYYTDHLVPYQVLWYWRLRGQAFPPDAVRAFTDLLEKLPREDNGMAETDDAWIEWRKARDDAMAKLDPQSPRDRPDLPPPSQQPPRWNASTLQADPNCFYGDAFRSATKTLAQRMTRAAADASAAPFVLHWLQAQDAVFDTCNKEPGAVPALPPAAPAWLQADQAYQLAARHFYAGQLDEADTAFGAIAADKPAPGAISRPTCACACWHGRTPATHRPAPATARTPRKAPRRWRPRPSSTSRSMPSRRRC